MNIDQDRNPGNAPVVDFVTGKYGRELKIDVAWIHEMPGFKRTDAPHRLSFYDITLITAGTGKFWLDADHYKVKPNTVFFTSPGQSRRWQVSGLDGLCLFFPAEFLLEHFNDPLFLHRLRFFHAERATQSFSPPAKDVARLRERMDTMHGEIAALQDDSPHLLRAIAYEILILLNRAYAKRHGQELGGSGNHVISRFRQLVESEFRTTHRVADYAQRLALTPGHLNFVCRKHLGQSAGDVIRGRVLAEARRLLIHADVDVGRISLQLGYDDPSYFSRVFKRATGRTPMRFRQDAHRDLGL